MKRLGLYKKLIIVLTFIAIIGTTYYGINTFLKDYIPDEMKIFVNEHEKFELNIPFDAKIYTEKIGVISVNESNVPAKDININLNKPFSIHSTEVGNYDVEIKLFGIIPIKKIKLDVIEKTQLIPGGLPVGVIVKTDGVMILGTGIIRGEDGNSYEPSKNLLKSGDYIIDINGIPIKSKEELVIMLYENGEKELTLGVKRNGEYINVTIRPVKSSSLNEYKIGIWVRDDTQGIGTITYIEQKNNIFGALGHGITDIDTKQLMSIQKGDLYLTQIAAIIKGEKGHPGELTGIITNEKQNKLGHVTKNTEYGIFGDVNENIYKYIDNKPMKIALKQEIKEGKAYIRSSLSGEMKDYEILIKSVDITNSHINKGMVIEVVDKELIEKTNGIVQGMSGSPIIQNNKIIGAVTHVFVQDSTKGYGTFIENMLRASKQ